MISAHAHATHLRIEERRDAFFNAPESILDGERIHGQVAKIRGAVLGKRVHLQDRVPGTNDRRLLAHVPRTEARPRPVGGPAVKRNPNQRDFQFFRIRNMR